MRAAPLSLFPFAQARINAMLEDADEETAAGQSAWADRLIDKARAEAEATRAMFEEAA
jgi:hypothetical protein